MRLYGRAHTQGQHAVARNAKPDREQLRNLDRRARLRPCVHDVTNQRRRHDSTYLSPPCPYPRCPAGLILVLLAALVSGPGLAPTPVDASEDNLFLPGFFSGTGSGPCIPAPAGTFVATSGATSATLCPEGTFSAFSGTIECDPAPAGTYVDQAGATSATDCPAGRYQNLEGQTSCNAAEAGTFVAVEGATAATPCAPGFYQPNVGQTSCIPADPGYFVATPGAIAQIPCPPGTTSEAGATECQNISLVIIGFYQPVDMDGVVNTVKGGSTVPFKFEVFNGNVELTDTAIVTMSVEEITCDFGAFTDDIVETVAIGGTGLRYDATAGQFVFNWKTPKKAGACYAVTATITDGPSVTALFKLK